MPQSQINHIELGLDRITNFLSTIGNPHHKLPKTIHVAGTNGKGSTIAFLRAILEGNGQTCHVYTSPHLIKFNERIVLAGKEISDEYLKEVMGKVQSSNLTYFEIITAAAFIAFSETKADWLLLETGLGGRLDATNVVPKKELAIITRISLDHTEFLGNNLKQIAYEKAGIVGNATCITAPQSPKVLKYLRENIKNLIEAEILDLDLPLVGEHQKINASLATAAAKYLGFTNFNGIKNAKWPGRLQKIKNIGEFELWVDCAHNEGGAKALAEALDQPVYMISGMLQTKDPAAFYGHLKNKIKQLYTVPIPNEPTSFSADELAKASQINARPTVDINSAIEEITKTQASGKIIICGSIYLIGSFLEHQIS